MKKGFTLIELLVVVLIIGILAAVALPQYQVAVVKSRYTQIMLLADSYKKAAELYHLSAGSWPNDFSLLDIAPPSGWIEGVNKAHIRTIDGNIQCTLQDGTGGGAIPTTYCSLVKEGMTYYPVSGTNRRLCGVRSSSAVGARVCKSLGGVYSSSIGSGLQYFDLP